ncbi:MAG TPA: hypothetical protein DDW53_00270 [Lachnoclostridium sp.]|nr:hypothetical protein [Lachnoclostridium sp.]
MRVSITVTPMCIKMLLSTTILRKQMVTREGELNMKSLIMPSLAHSSQRERSSTSSMVRHTLTLRRCSFSFSINSCWAKVG